MDHNASGTNWGSAVSGTTFTDVTAVSAVSLQSGAMVQHNTAVKNYLLMINLKTLKQLMLD